MANHSVQHYESPRCNKIANKIQNEYQLESEHGLLLIEGFGQIHGTDTYTDVALLVGGKRIAAHKIMLAAFSPYFKALLSPNMQEGRCDEIELHHLNGDMVEKLVQFAYTGKISYSDENVQDVLEVANFFDIKMICRHCARYIAKRIDSQNFVDVYSIGKQLGEQILCKTASKFFFHNFATLAMSEEFLRSPIEILEEALKSEKLQFHDPNVIPIPANQEHGLLNAVLAYVKHDIDARLSLLPDLLSRIRLPVIFPRVLLELKENSLIKECSASLALVEKALSTQGLVYVASEDTEPWRVPRQNCLLKQCVSRAFAGGGKGSDIVERYMDYEYVSGNVHLVGMKIWIRRWDGRPVWGGYEAYYSNGTALKHGGDNFGFEVHEFHLEEGEVVTNLGDQGMDRDSLLNKITFCTNKGRVFGPYNGDGGNECQNAPFRPNQGFLVCTQGHVAARGGEQAITCLTFQWSHASLRNWSIALDENDNPIDPIDPGKTSESDFKFVPYYLNRKLI